MVEYRQSEGKKRSLAGNVGLGFFVFAFILICIAFVTPSWLVSDYRITGAKFDRLGLWTHCFRSLRDPNDPRQGRFFVGCRWIYDPFTTGYDEIRGFLVPGFMVATLFFFTICFICALISAIISLLYFLCWGPEQQHYLMLIRINAWSQLVGGLSGGLAVIIFASLGNRNGWMPGHENNFFGWSFVLACVGSVASLVAATLFFTELNIQAKKKERLRGSQTRFELHQETKA